MSHGSDQLKTTRDLVFAHGKSLAANMREKADELTAAAMRSTPQSVDVRDRAVELIQLSHAAIERATERLENELDKLLKDDRYNRG